MLNLRSLASNYKGLVIVIIFNQKNIMLMFHSVNAENE